jgi:hypothetical protein
MILVLIVFLVFLVFLVVVFVVNLPNVGPLPTRLDVWSVLMGSVSRVGEGHLLRSTLKGIWRAAGDVRARSVAAAHVWRRDERASVMMVWRIKGGGW